MEIFCAHLFASSFLEACSRTWIRSWVWSPRRSAYGLEQCAGQREYFSRSSSEFKQEVKDLVAVSFSGCALWMEPPSPRPGSCRRAAVMLLWEPKSSRNFHMWSCWVQKLQRGIVNLGALSVSQDVFFFHLHLFYSNLTNNDQVSLFLFFIDITLRKGDCWGEQR